jgi:hypothetical protein
LHGLAEAFVRGTATKAEHLPEKSVINMIWLLFPVSDWPIIWIARGGFLWIVSYPLKSQFQFYGPGWIGNKSKELNLGCEKCFTDSHTKHQWSCSKTKFLINYKLKCICTSS